MILYQRAFLSLSLLICRMGRREPWAWCGCADSVTTHLLLARHRCPVSALVPLPRRQDGVGGLSRVLLEEQEEKVQAAMREAAELGTAGGSPTEVGRGLPRVGKDVTNKEGRDPRGRVSLGKPRRQAALRPDGLAEARGLDEADGQVEAKGTSWVTLPTQMEQL